MGKEALSMNLVMSPFEMEMDEDAFPLVFITGYLELKPHEQTHEKDLDDPQDEIQPRAERKRPGRSSLLVKFMDENPSVVLDQAMKRQTGQFAKSRISKTRLYNFMTEKCSTPTFQEIK
ncbi:hypothetical protein DFQ30_003674 [Apophysomyces sp. BC1015]|nr:hypothetical protein DFQ30_003674 [Apophysomyces sp. BC1015]